MSTNVDVLAVMDRCADAVEAYSTKVVLRDAGLVSECTDRGLRAARDAVAELIAAHKACRQKLMHDDRQQEVVCIDPAEWKRVTDAIAAMGEGA